MRSIVMGILIVVTQTAAAQFHNSAWFRGTMDFSIRTKWKVDAELQHRRKNGDNNRDLLYENLLFSFRNWIHYQQTDQLKFSISPLAYFSHYKQIETNAGQSVVHEMRFAAAVEVKKLLHERISFSYKAGLEYRMFLQSSNSMRIRNRIGIDHPFSEQVKITLFDEAFLQITGKPGYVFQNRLGLDLEWRISSKLKLDLGYIFSSNYSEAHKHVPENDFFLNLSCEI